MQRIYEPTFDLTFNYFATGSYSENAASPLSTTVTFTNILKFEQVVVGAPYKIDFNLLGPATGFLFNMPTGVTTESISVIIKVEGNQILNEVFTYDSTATPTLNQDRPIGYIFSSANPTVEITITYPRVRDDTIAVALGTLDRTVSTSLVLTQYNQAYNPTTDCCVLTCPANSGIELPVLPSTTPTCVVC